MNEHEHSRHATLYLHSHDNIDVSEGVHITLSSYVDNNENNCILLLYHDSDAYKIKMYISKPSSIFKMIISYHREIYVLEIVVFLRNINELQE